MQEKAVSTKKVFHRLKCDSFELIRSEEGLKCVIIESYSIFSFFLSFLIFIIFFSFDEKKVFFVHPFHQHLTCYGHLCMYKKTIYPLDSCDPLLHITSTLSTLFLYIFTFGSFAQFKHWICELNLLFNTIREFGYNDLEFCN